MKAEWKGCECEGGRVLCENRAGRRVEHYWSSSRDDWVEADRMQCEQTDDGIECERGIGAESRSEIEASLQRSIERLDDSEQPVAFIECRVVDDDVECDVYVAADDAPRIDRCPDPLDASNERPDGSTTLWVRDGTGLAEVTVRPRGSRSSAVDTGDCVCVEGIVYGMDGDTARINGNVESC